MDSKSYSLAQLRSNTLINRAVCMVSKEFGLLQNVKVFKVSNGEEKYVTDLVLESASASKCIMPFTTHFGDLSSFELCQKLRYFLPKLEEKGISVRVVGIGSLESARLFAQQVPFPQDLLYCDPSAAAAAALSLRPGFGRQSALDPQQSPLSPYLKLLPMLLGIGSPGTIPRVLYGYVGDGGYGGEWVAAQLAKAATGNFPYVDPALFDRLGAGYLRPFQLATLRLQNMITVLSNWSNLIPENQDLVVQQGGTLVWQAGEVVWRWDDLGILGYAPLEEAMDAASR